MIHAEYLYQLFYKKSIFLNHNVEETSFDLFYLVLLRKTSLALSGSLEGPKNIFKMDWAAVKGHIRLFFIFP